MGQACQLSAKTLRSNLNQGRGNIFKNGVQPQTRFLIHPLLQKVETSEFFCFICDRKLYIQSKFQPIWTCRFRANRKKQQKQNFYNFWCLKHFGQQCICSFPLKFNCLNCPFPRGLWTCMGYELLAQSVFWVRFARLFYFINFILNTFESNIKIR